MSDSSWDDPMRRVANGEPFDEVMEERALADRVAFRQILMGMGDRGRKALVAYDRITRESDLGLTSAWSTWDALSPAQRVALREASEGRQPTARIATLRNLERRGLIAWDGGVFAPEAKVVITERGFFVLRHARERTDG